MHKNNYSGGEFFQNVAYLKLMLSCKIRYVFFIIDNRCINYHFSYHVGSIVPRSNIQSRYGNFFVFIDGENNRFLKK